MMGALKVITPPTVEPISLDDAKSHAVIFIDDDDDLLELLVQSCREYGENYTRRAYCQRTLELSLPNWPCDGVIKLPKPPLVSIESVKYIDASGNLQTINPALYQINTAEEPGLLKPAYNCLWPVVRCYDFNAVRVTYVAGYTPVGDDGTADEKQRRAVPAQFRTWMKVRVAQLAEHREAVITGTIIADLPKSYVDGQLDALIVNLF